MKINALILCLALLTLQAEAYGAETATQILETDESILKERVCLQAKKATSKRIPSFEEAFSAIELNVYGSLGKGEEHAVFEEICILSKFGHPVWQIYLSRMFYDGREWLEKDSTLAYKFYEMVCNNTCLLEETYDLDPFAQDHLTYLQEIFKNFWNVISLPERFKALTIMK